jgi:hypothetical protein
VGKQIEPVLGRVSRMRSNRTTALAQIKAQPGASAAEAIADDPGAASSKDSVRPNPPGSLAAVKSLAALFEEAEQDER